MGRSARRQAVGRGAERIRAFVALWARLFREHELLTYASAIARTTIVAAVALALLMLGVAGALGDQSLWYVHVAPVIRPRVLPGVYAGIDQTVVHIFAANSPGLIVFAIVLAIWEVSGSVRGISGALNRIYETEERRSWKVRFPVSFALAAAIVVAIVGAILLVMAVGGGVHGVLAFPLGAARWLAAILLIAAAFGLIVRFASAEPRAKKWASVGAGLVVAGWVVESIAFRWYVTSVANFHTATGSLAVILVVVGYLYTGAIILLVGIELDELLREEGALAERTVVGIVVDFVRATRPRARAPRSDRTAQAARPRTARARELRRRRSGATRSAGRRGRR